MKKILSFIFIIIMFFFIVRTTYAVETRQTNPIIELLNIFLNFGNSIGNAPSSDSNPNIVTPTTAAGYTNASLPSATALSVENYLPNPIPPLSDKVTEQDKNNILSCLSNRDIYEQAARYHGLPWEILATLHFMEIGCGSGSLVSGRAIGENEPDVVRSGGCSSAVAGPGKPIPLPGGGCGFASLLDSAIYAGKIFKIKLGGRNPDNFEDVVKAFALYNGAGNKNCRATNPTPYTGCPPFFPYEDHIYPMNKFDLRHSVMWVVYCSDGQRCDPYIVYQKVGAITALRILTGK